MTSGIRHGTRRTSTIQNALLKADKKKQFLPNQLENEFNAGMLAIHDAQQQKNVCMIQEAMRGGLVPI